MKHLLLLLLLGLTIQTSQAQSASCRADTAYLDASGIAVVPASNFDGGSSSPNMPLTFTVDGSSAITYTCRNIGLNDVILTVTDAQGVSVTCSATAVILDTLATGTTACAPLHQADSAAMYIFKRYGFLAQDVRIPTHMNINDRYYYNNLGIRTEDVTGQLRIDAIYLGSTRANNGFTVALSLDSVARAFANDGLIELETLHIYNNNLTGTFNNFPMLDSMSQIAFYDNAGITDMFRVSTWPNVMDVYADGCNISQVPAQLFTACPLLRDVNLSRNPITQMPPPDVLNATLTFTGGFSIDSVNYYSGLANLEYLKLQDMQLGAAFHIDHFIGAQLASGITRKLAELKINNNRLDRVESRIADMLLRSPVATFNTNFAQLNFPTILPSANPPIDLSRNKFDFQDLQTILAVLGLRVDDAAVYMVYAQQDSVGVGGVRRRGSGQFYNFELESRDPVFSARNEAVISANLASIGAVRNYYNWMWTDPTGSPTNAGGFVPGGLTLSPPSGWQTLIVEYKDSAAAVNRPTLSLSADASLNQSTMSNIISNNNFPNLALYSRPKTLIFGDCFDNLGQVIQCQELSVQFDDTTSAAVREQRRADFGATVVASCVCNKVELWALSDTFQQVSMEANGAGTRIASTQASTKPGLKSADPNYPLLWGNTVVVDTTPNMNAVQGTTNNSRTLVAIIDSGSDPDHPTLSAHLRRNADETLTGGDDDGNCEINDIIGYNFVDRNNTPYDDHGHGTAVAGIVAGYGSPSLLAGDTSLAILPIKYTDRLGRGTSFEASCAIYYAADYHLNNNNGSRDADSVRVINASWGYQGEYCRLLHDAIDYAGKNCGILFVCSAGNESSDNDQVAHYPSNFELDNILAVTACEPNGSALSGYANYGAGAVDIAAEGSFTNTLVPQVGTSPSVNPNAWSGTSFATALVSRAAGELFHQYPDASYAAVKAALMSSVSPLGGTDGSKVRSGGYLNYNAAAAYLDTMSIRNVCAHQLSTGTSQNIEARGNQSVSLYPNPSEGHIEIRLEQLPSEMLDIEIIDVKGLKVWQGQAAAQVQTSLELSALPAGFYVVRLRVDGQWSSHKFLKM